MAVLTAAIAQRFVGEQVGGEVEQAEAALAATEVEVLDEISAIRQRLERLETTLRGRE